MMVRSMGAAAAVAQESETQSVGEYGFEEFCDTVERFHGSPAPGVLVGGFMVELARQGLPEGTLFEALCETRVCLPDAIQLLTPCTLGNGRVKVVHVGRFALSLYDKYTGVGRRVFLDVRKMGAWPEIRSWFLKLKPKAEQDSPRLLREIGMAGTAVLGFEPIALAETFIRKQKLGRVQLCPRCGEAFPTSAGEVCGGCRGELPYATSSAPR
jgi:formylmethanofuran dehydrogenase subunit E